MPESADQTSLKPTFITDSMGGVWGLAPSSTVAQVVYNGAVQTSALNVTKLQYHDKIVYHQNTAGDWYAWQNNAWAKSAAPGQQPTTESPDGTTVTAVGPKIVSGSGEPWTLVATPSSGMRIAVNSVTDTTTSNVTLLVYKDKKVYQQNSAGGWWVKTKSSDTWMGSADPRATAPTNPGTGPSSPIKYGSTPPKTITNVGGRASPLGWQVGLYDDFTGWTESTSNYTVNTGGATWYLGGAPSWFGQSQEMIAGSLALSRAGIAGATKPFLQGGANPYSHSGSVLSITAYPATSSTVSALQRLGGGYQAVPVKKPGGSYPPAIISGALCSAKTFNQGPDEQFYCGYFECNMKCPTPANGNAQGLWTSFWLNYTQSNYSPEIDIWEYMVGATQTGCSTTLHHGNPKSGHTGIGQIKGGGDLAKAFHTYGCLWTPAYVAIYLDGNLQCSIAQNGQNGSGGTRANDGKFGPQSPLDIRLLFSLGWYWDNGYYVNASQLPATWQIDWVRWSKLGPQ